MKFALSPLETSEFVTLRDAMDRLFEDSFVRPLAETMPAFPVDLHEGPEAYVLKAPLPGLRPEEIEINATADGVTIRGEFKRDGEVKEDSYLRQERRYGKFQRSFTLPLEIDPDKIEAKFEHGVLILTMAKAATVKPKQIRVVAKA